jgi:hypothetical protein
MRTAIMPFSQSGMSFSQILSAKEINQVARCIKATFLMMGKVLHPMP